MLLLKNKSTTIFVVYTLIDHRIDAIKCSKLCSETTRLRLAVPLEFVNISYFLTVFK